MCINHARVVPSNVVYQYTQYILDMGEAHAKLSKQFMSECWTHQVPLLTKARISRNSVGPLVHRSGVLLICKPNLYNKIGGRIRPR